MKNRQKLWQLAKVNDTMTKLIGLVAETPDNSFSTGDIIK